MRCLIAELRERPRVWARMGFPAVCYTVGAILQMVGGANLDGAAESLRKAVQLKPSRRDAWGVLAHVLAEKGDLIAAADARKHAGGWAGQ